MWTESNTVTLKVEKQIMDEKFPNLVNTFKAGIQSGKKSTGKVLFKYYLFRKASGHLHVSSRIAYGPQVQVWSACRYL